MIVFDPEGISVLVQYAKTANDNVTRALSMLQRIQDHSDWSCQEKYRVNEFCDRSKAKVAQLQSRTEAFLSAVDAAARNSKSVQDAVIFRINDINTEILNAIAVVDSSPKCCTPPPDSYGTTQIPRLMEKIIADINAEKTWNPDLSGAEAANVAGPISVVQFPGSGN